MPYLPSSVAYVRGQLECGATNGYLHWQLLVVFRRSVRLRAVKETFGHGDSWRFELTRSNAANEYVWKDDTAVVGTRFELGSLPVKRNNKRDWERIWTLAQEGKLDEIPFDVRLQHYRTLRAIEKVFFSSFDT